MCGPVRVGCGGAPAINAHESYKGSFGSSPAVNYSSRAYQGAPLPRTAQTGSYAMERVYSPITEKQPMERIYAQKPLMRDAVATIGLASRENPRQESPKRYDQQASIGQLADLEDTYAKMRFLERKIGEAMMAPQNNIEPLVNVNG